jgi:pyridoxal phosphate-dependent aminotransferase EpsN
MLVSPHEAAIDRARFLGAHHARDPLAVTDHAETGFNYRMSNVLGGLGRSQLRVLPERVDARRAVFERYSQMLGKHACLEWMPEAPYGRSTHWLSVVLVDPQTGRTPAQIVDALAAEGIESRRVFRPLHTQPVFRGTKFYSHDERESAHGVCERLFETGVCLPSSSSLEITDQARVVSALESFLQLGHSRRSEPTLSPVPSTPNVPAMPTAAENRPFTPVEIAS